MNKHKFAVFIGRFSPTHLGHNELLLKAFEVAEKVIVVLGSHNRAKNIKNPWSSLERQEMIELTLTEDQKSKLSFIKMKDYLYSDNQWILTLQNKIAEATNEEEDVALIGFNSDESSYYLKFFPKWKFYNCPTQYDFHATQIRDFLFTKDNAYKNCVHPKVAEHLAKWSSSKEFVRLKDEFDYIREYKEKWRGSPFKVTFVTTDAVVIKSGHILLIRRGKSYGKGLLACPGGYLNSNERIEDAVIRELIEETEIDVKKDDLYKSVVSTKVFDYPNRSERGRTISHASMLNLGYGNLPKVIGSDDAASATWIPLNEIMEKEDEFFEDHFYIIQSFLQAY